MGKWVAALGERRSATALEEERRKTMLVFPDIDSFTCDRCPLASTCEFAFDPYNTNGDCLAEK